MRTLLEIKEIVIKIYGKYEVFIIPVLKFLLALVSLLAINSRLGYMRQVDNIGVVLIASLLCSFLPNGFILLFGAVFILLHLYALAIEVALVGLGVFLIMALVFFRFSPRDSLAVLFTPLCFFFKVPYVMPIAAGLLRTPASVVSVGCGVVVHYLISFVSENATSISALDESETVARLRLVIDALLGNRAMVVMIVAFAVTIIAVYLIRRMSIDYSWTIAIIAGVMLDAVILLIGDLVYNTNVSVLGILLGAVIAALLGKLLQFLVFNIDYNRTERVQFEDDEYYYYVKAVPKLTVAAPEKTVKKINTQVSGRSHVQTRDPRAGEGRRPVAAGGRTVTVERTGSAPRGVSPRTQSGHTVTGSYRQEVKPVDTTKEITEDQIDDFEEL